MALAACDLRTISFSQLFPVNVAWALAGHLTLAIAYIHSRGYAHGGIYRPRSSLFQQKPLKILTQACFARLDIHLGNVLARLPSPVNTLSIKELYKQYGEPEPIRITRCDGKPLSHNVTSLAVTPLSLAQGKRADEFLLHDSNVLLSDFGEAYCPKLESRLGKDCHTPLGSRPPESRFEPDAPLLWSADIWSLAVTIWEILGMKALFSNEFPSIDEVAAQQVDVLGPMPSEWWNSWDEKSQFFDVNGHALRRREAWPPLDVAFEEFIQKSRRKRPKVGMFSDNEREAILDLMRRMLTFKPGARPTADDVLKSEWMTKWVLPDVERSRNGTQAGVDVL